MTLQELVERERRGVSRQLLVSVAGFVGATALILLLIAVIALGDGRWLALPRLVPFIAWAMVAAVGYFVWQRLRGRAESTSATPALAKVVEQERKLRAGSLRGILEVADSGVLGQLAASKLADTLATGGPALAPALRKRVARRAGIGLGAAALGLLGVTTAAVAAPDGLQAVLHPVKAWNGTLIGAVAIEGAPRHAIRGERITMRVLAPGRSTITVGERVTGSSWRTREVPVVDGAATIAVGPLDADVSVYATDGRSSSDTSTVQVAETPFVGDVTLTATFPGYLGRAPETLQLGGLLRVPRGTVLGVTGSSSAELASVSLEREGAEVPFAISGRSFTGQLVATASGRYEWKAQGVQGPILDRPAALELDVLPDSAPIVEIISPSRDSSVAATDSVRVSVLATDDHGLAGVVLRIATTNARGEVRSSTTRPLSGSGVEQYAGVAIIPIRGLTPGDAMRITAIATDGSPWRQVGQSKELVLRLPSASDQREIARAAADSTLNKALAAANAQKQLNQRTQDAARAQEREKKNGDSTLTFEAAEQAKKFAKEQRDLADRMQQVQDAAKNLEQQLKQAGALDTALQNRLREAQQLMRDALTPELAEKLRNLEQASQNMAPDQARAALQDLAEQQKKLREMLDKSVEMLKRAALEGAMETLKDEAQELAQKQRDLVDSLRKADEAEERSAAEQMAKDLAEKAKDLQKNVKDLQKRLQQEKADAGAERAAEAGEKVDESLKKLQEALQKDQQGGEKQEGQQSGEQKQGQQGEKGQQGQAGQKQEGQQGEKGQQGQQGEKGQQGQEGKGQQGDKSAAGNQGAQEGQQSNADAAEKAAEAMEQAASELEKARQQQVGEWKKELSGELDQSIQEMLQLARQQDQLEQKAKAGAPAGEMRSQQSALQQGVNQAMTRLQDAGKKSNLLSQRSLNAVNDARRRVEDATQQTMRAQTGQQMASAMRDASEGLNQAAASLVRDRERTQNSQSSTGFAEMLEQLQKMAQQQQQINSAMQDLVPKQGQKLDRDDLSEARQLAREQREVASRLEEAADKENSGRTEEMAREARQIAQQLESANLDPAVLERQQRLFRKMLDAGRLLEEDEREDSGKREAKPWTGSEVFTPDSRNAAGKSATKFGTPTWGDLRGLTAEERRLVLDYFKRINGKP